MHPKYNLSGQEYEIMKILWKENREMTLGDIDELLRKASFGPTIGTVKTYLQRLVKKGALTTRKEGHKLWYCPSADEARFEQQWARGFLEDCFGGSLSSFISALNGRKKLSEKEKELLRDLYHE